MLERIIPITANRKASATRIDAYRAVPITFELTIPDAIGDLTGAESLRVEIRSSRTDTTGTPLASTIIESPEGQDFDLTLTSAQMNQDLDGEAYKQFWLLIYVIWPSGSVEGSEDAELDIYASIDLFINEHAASMSAANPPVASGALSRALADTLYLSSATVDILIEGDSHADWDNPLSGNAWPTQARELSSDFAGATITNNAVNSRTAASINTDFATASAPVIAASLHAIVLVQAGSNDILSGGASAASAAAILEAIALKAINAGAKRVYFITAPTQTTAIQAMNTAMMAAINAGTSNFTAYIDVLSIGGVVFDGYHFDDASNKFAALRVIDELYGTHSTYKPSEAIAANPAALSAAKMLAAADVTTLQTAITAASSSTVISAPNRLKLINLAGRFYEIAGRSNVRLFTLISDVAAATGTVAHGMGALTAQNLSLSASATGAAWDTQGINMSGRSATLNFQLPSTFTIVLVANPNGADRQIMAGGTADYLPIVNMGGDADNIATGFLTSTGAASGVTSAIVGPANTVQRIGIFSCGSDTILSLANNTSRADLVDALGGHTPKSTMVFNFGAGANNWDFAFAGIISGTITNAQAFAIRQALKELYPNAI